MRSYLLLMTSLLLAVAPVAAHNCRGYGHHYDPHGCANCAQPGCCAQSPAASLETWKGAVSEVRPAPNPMGITEVWLKTADSTILVRLGPAGFLKQNGLTLKEGDAITVKGYRAASSDGDLLIATEVQAAGKTVPLRGSGGRPLW